MKTAAVSIHSRLKAAAEDYPVGVYTVSVSIHSRLKAAGDNDYNVAIAEVFQYTAA